MLWCNFQEIFAKCNVLKFCAMSSSKRFIGLGLTFMSLSHFESNFYMAFVRVQIHCSYLDIQFFLAPFAEKTVPFEYFLHPCQK